MSLDDGGSAVPITRKHRNTITHLNLVVPSCEARGDSSISIVRGGLVIVASGLGGLVIVASDLKY